MVNINLSIAEVELQSDTESDTVCLYDSEFFCYVTINRNQLKGWIDTDRKILNFIFNNNKILCQISSLSLSILLLFPKSSWGQSESQKLKSSNQSQIEKIDNQEKVLIGTITDYRSQIEKNTSKKKSLLDQLKLEGDSLKIRRVQVRPKPLESFTEEKFILPEIPEIVRYKTLPIRIKSPKNFSASSFKTPENFSASYEFPNLVPEWVSTKTTSYQRIKDLQTVRSIIHLRGGFQIFSLGVLISKFVEYTQEKRDVEVENLSQLQTLKNSRQEKVRLFCLGLISFLVLLAGILFIFATKSSVDAQIILRMQEKLSDISKQQEKLKMELVDLTKMLLQFGEMTRGFEETTSSAVESLLQKVDSFSQGPQGGDREGMSSRNFKKLWVNQCKKVILNFVLSNQVPEISNLFSDMENAEEISTFIENVCQGNY